MTGAALSTNEMLAVLGSRALKDGQTVFTGVGAPMLATALAQRRHAPRLTMVVEGGIVGPQWRPGWLPISTNEIRALEEMAPIDGGDVRYRPLNMG